MYFTKGHAPAKPAVSRTDIQIYGKRKLFTGPDGDNAGEPYGVEMQGSFS